MLMRYGETEWPNTMRRILDPQQYSDMDRKYYGLRKSFTNHGTQNPTLDQSTLFWVTGEF